jgi:Kef-type K+ transport system membrane component KefB
VPETLGLLLTFGLISLASHRIGKWFTAIGLPYITGYLAVGAVAGAFVLDVLPSGAADQLRFVDEISLGVIAFVAGSELYLPDLRSRLRPILSMTAGVAVVGAIVIGVSIYLLTGVLSFTADLDTPARIATAMLGAAVLLALSPPSTIAVIKEVGARGPFTSTALSVTIVMDVVVVVAFAAAASISGVLIRGDALGIGFVGVLAIDLALAIGLGFVLGRFLGFVLARRLPVLVTAAVVLALGFGVYELADLIDAWSTAALPFEIYIEPLLLTLVAGFTVTNFTEQRGAFEEVLHAVGPAVYVAFFTLTGVSLKLDTLLAVLPAAVALFAVRIVAIAIGTFLGARLGGAEGALRRRTWLALITQAGIALGLAREAGLQFPTLGAAFTTLIIAVVVLNEVFGPMMLKWVLQQVGEAAQDRDDRHVVIHGDDRSADLLATRLGEDGWSIGRVVASPPPEEEDEVGSSVPVLAPPDAVVALGGDDADNLRICSEAADAGVETIIARVRDATLLDRFLEIGVVVVDPTTADVTLLESAVRTPDAANLILRPDEDRSTEQITVHSAGGRQLRELRLPQDVLVMTVRHGRTSLVPDGFTRIHDGDQLTLVGPADAIAEAAARLGG